MKSYSPLLRSLYFHLVLILLSQCHSKLASKVSSSRVILAALGDDVELPCFFPIPREKNCSFRIQWVKYTPGMTQPKDILLWPPFSSLPNYKWDLDSLMLGNLSLTLKKVNTTDSGLYGCAAWDGWECVMARNITLKVKDCVALTPVTAQTNNTALLPCTFPNASENTQSVNVTWKLVLAEKQQILLQFPPSSKQSLPTHMKFKMDPRTGDASLMIFNLTHSDTSWYRCQLVLGQSSQCYEVRLEVKDFVSEETTTFGMSTMTVKQGSITDEQHDNKSTGIRTVVTIALLSVFMCILVASVASAFYIKRCRSSPGTTDEDVPQAYYSNVDFQHRNSAHVLNTVYTLTNGADIWSSDQSFDSRSSGVEVEDFGGTFDGRLSK